MRRRRNGIAGVSSAEYAHAKWNPRGRRSRSRPSRGGNGSGVLLGILSELVVDVKGKTLEANSARLKGLFLAWMPGDNALAIVRKTNGRPGRLSAQAMKIHREFHDVPPQRATAFDRPRRDSSCKKVGLIRSLTYRIPAGLKSPQKSQAIWVHKFGDHGEEGHGPLRGEKQYSDSLKPYLLENSKGDLFIQRRPGNKYDVTKWIYW
jgi:hypothetical protein